VVQNIRQEFTDNVEAGGGQKGDAGVAGDIFRALPTGWSPSTGDRTGADDAGYAGYGKGPPAIGVLRNDGAESRVTGPRPKAVFARREIPVVFVKDHGGPVGDGLTNSVIGQVAAEALSVSTPTLPPFFGGIFPLAYARAYSLAQDRDGPTRAEQI